MRFYGFLEPAQIEFEEAVNFSDQQSRENKGQDSSKMRTAMDFLLKIRSNDVIMIDFKGGISQY